MNKSWLAEIHLRISQSRDGELDHIGTLLKAKTGTDPQMEGPMRPWGLCCEGASLD